MAGDISSFGPEECALLSSSIRHTLTCHEPTCGVRVHAATAGSINILATVTVPDPLPGAINDTSAVVATVLAAAESLVAQNVTAISGSLGVTIESMVELTVTQHVPVAMVVQQTSPPSAAKNSFFSDNLSAQIIGAVIGALCAAFGAFLVARRYHQQQARGRLLLEVTGVSRLPKEVTAVDSTAIVEQHSEGVLMVSI